MGLASYDYAPDTGGYTQGVNSSYAYYTSNSTRKKNKGDNGSFASYWTRSRSKYGPYHLCFVFGTGLGGSGTYDDNTRGLAPALVIS